MPLYEYECECGHTFEEVFKSRILAEALRTMPCPMCGKQSRRLISKSNFHLKGGAWAKDGYVNPDTKD